MWASLTLCSLSVVLVSIVSGVSAEGGVFTLREPGGNVTLSCDGLSGPITWKRNNEVLPESNVTLFLKKVLGDQVGIYTCNNSDSSRTVTLFAAPFVKKQPVDRSVTLTQGDDLVLRCTAWGHPLPTIKWKKVTRLDDGEVELTNSDRVLLTNNGELANGTLTVSNVTIDDYGTYTCIAANGYDYVSDSNTTYNRAETLVRVKDKFTPLWPFIGIVIEVIILLVIIIVYEKRKTKESDSDVKDEAPVSNSNDHNETVRLRK